MGLWHVTDASYVPADNRWYVFLVLNKAATAGWDWSTKCCLVKSENLLLLLLLEALDLSTFAQVVQLPSGPYKLPVGHLLATDHFTAHRVKYQTISSTPVRLVSEAADIRAEGDSARLCLTAPLSSSHQTPVDCRWWSEGLEVMVSCFTCLCGTVQLYCRNQGSESEQR